MAVLGKLFNYEKPGPGVDKNAPQKKGFKLFWEIFTEKFWKLIPLSLLYTLCCLPVVTVGFADVGLTYVTRNFARRKPVMMVSDFFETIKKNWKQALIVGIINLLATAILIFAMVFYFIYWNIGGLFYQIGLIVAGCSFIVLSFLKYYINFLVITFDLSIKQLYKNSVLLSSAGLKANLIITGAILALTAVFFAIPLVCAYIMQDDLILIIFMLLAILFLPAIISLVIQFCIFPVIKSNMIDPYYEKHPEEAKKDKALLNIFEDEEDGEDAVDEDAVFKDMGSTASTPEPSESSIPKQYSKRDIKRMRRDRDDIDDDTI